MEKAKFNATPSEASSCVTETDASVEAYDSKTAAVGTKCVFGADPKDEGSHCIPEKQYGEFGWCYTKLDLSEWGSCAPDCPTPIKKEEKEAKKEEEPIEEEAKGGCV